MNDISIYIQISFVQIKRILVEKKEKNKEQDVGKMITDDPPVRHYFLSRAGSIIYKLHFLHDECNVNYILTSGQ